MGTDLRHGSRPVRSALRWLLQLDQPVPAHSDEEVTDEVARNYRWNFTANLLDGATFWFGISFASTTTILPLFVSKLTSSPLALGLLAVLAQSAWFLPQLFTANAVEQLPRKKPVAVNLAVLLEGMPMWWLVVAAAVAGQSPGLALITFLMGYAWHSLGSGVVATAYQDLIARCFPVDRRGRVLGIQAVLGFGAGALGSAFSAWLLRTFPFPTDFLYTFTVAATAITVSFLFLGLTREPVQLVSVPPQSNRQFWAGLPKILRRDHNYRHFLVARMLMAMGGMGGGFVAVEAVVRWRVPDSTVGGYTGVLLVGQTMGNLILGWLADRSGHKLSLELTALASVLAFALAWLAPSPAWYYAVFVLLGFTAGGIMVSGILIVMEFCEPGRRPTYVGMASTGVGLVSMVVPLLGAWLAGLSYSWLFALSTAANLVALVAMRWWVQEPRWANVLSSAKLNGG